MKRASIFILPMLIIFLACGNRQKEKHYNQEENGYADYNEDYRDNEHEAPMYETLDVNYDDENELKESSKRGESKGFFSEKLGQKGLKVHELKDARTGLIVRSSEYPADWQVISKPYYTIDQKIPRFLMQVQGPNHLKSFNTPINFHVQYNNPQIVQYLPQGKIRNMVRAEVSVRQIFGEEVEQRMVNSGFIFQHERKMPRLEAFFEQEKQKQGIGNGRLDLYVTQWTNNKGQSALASITKIIVPQPSPVPDAGFTMWMYSIEYLFVDDEALEKTIDQFVESAINTKENPEWKQYMVQLTQQRQREANERLRIANMQHQQNMANRQAAFDAHQQRMKELSAAQDASHAAFMNRNFGSGSNTGQKQFLNMINEQETVYNPLTGKNYQVDAGSTEYWTDSNGNYIQNNDLFYSPNGDINLNNREWVKVGNDY